MKKAIIFDLDGVLVFTDRFHFQAWKLLADRLGIPFDEKVNDLLRGVSRMESLEIILRRGSGSWTQEEKNAMAEEKNENYKALLRTMRPSDVADEVRSTLQELRRKGLKLAIGSSSKNTRFILEQVNLTEYFDAISDGTNITRSKPDPEVFLKAAEFLNIPPQECAVVEDALSGIQAAKAAGMTAIGIGNALTPEQVDVMLQSFNNLTKMF